MDLVISKAGQNNMSGNYLSDEEIDWLHEEAGVGPPVVETQAVMPAVAGQVPMSGAPVYPIYPVPGMGQSSAQPGPSESLLTRQMGPLPMWGWGLLAAGVGVGGFFWWQSQQKKVEPNSPDGDAEPSRPALGAGEESGGGWSPSRSRFGDQLRRYFTRKGMADRCAIYTDADEAKKKLKHVSPLVTIKVEGAFKADKDMEKLCRREGLSAVAHEDGSIGFYPTESKKGREWEEYIDALRDEGQTV